MKASRIAYAGLVLIALLLAMCLTACHTARPLADARANAELQAPRVGLDTAGMSPALMSATPHPLTPSPVERGRPALLPRLADAVGLSTREGRARRHAVKLARASVPRSIGKGAVYAPNNTGKILSGGNKSGPVANADTGAVLSQTTIDKNKGAAATGPHASATQAIEKPGFWATVAAGLSWWWLLIPGAYVAWRLYRKTIPFAS